MRNVLAFVLAAGLTGAGCSGGSSNSLPTGTPPPPTPPTAPTPTISSETFAGTVAVGGVAFHPFTVTLAGGQITIILTAAGPPATIFMGLGVGTIAGDACTLLPNASVATPAGATAQLTGTISAGSYCVRVWDIGNQTADVTYAVTVNHY